MKKVYVEEWKNYSDVFERCISQKQAVSMVKRLKKHFDLKPTEIVFDKYNIATASPYKLRFLKAEKQSMGLIAHEVAHQFCYKKYGENMHHNKKFKKCMKLIITYVRKREYWKEIYKDTTIDLKYRINADSWVEEYKVERSIKKERQNERDINKCPGRVHGTHRFFHISDTIDTVNRKVFVYRCQDCELEKEED